MSKSTRSSRTRCASSMRPTPGTFCWGVVRLVAPAGAASMEPMAWPTWASPRRRAVRRRAASPRSSISMSRTRCSRWPRAPISRRHCRPASQRSLRWRASTENTIPSPSMLSSDPARRQPCTSEASGSRHECRVTTPNGLRTRRIQRHRSLGGYFTTRSSAAGERAAASEMPLPSRAFFLAGQRVG